MNDKIKGKIPVISARDKMFYNCFFVALFILFVLATYLAQFNPFEALLKSETFFRFLREDFFPPVVKRPDIVLSAIAVTVGLAFIASFLAMIFAFFTAVFVCTRVSPIPKLAKFIRAIVTLIRNIPTLMWAFILFSALGTGTGVAVIALMISSFGFLTRAFVEVMDELPPGSLEFVSGCGGTFGQKVFHNVVPNCLPGCIEWVLYNVDVNIRASTAVGMVGGGGIGGVLFMYIKGFDYQMAAAIILIIALLVIIVEFIMTRIKKSLSLST